MSEITKAEVNLGDNGGQPIFGSYSDLRDFATTERDAWSWMRTTAEPSGHHGRMPDRIDVLINHINASEHGHRPLTHVVDELPSYFDKNGNNIVHHESALGSLLLSIREKVSPPAAAFAYAIHRGWANMGQANSPDLLRGALMAVAPGVIESNELVEDFSRERANYRADLRRIMAEAALAEANRAAALASATDAARKSIRRWATRRALRWHRYSDSQKTEGQAAIAAVRAVQLTYEEFMALQAPSTYWRRKAEAHRRSETFAGWRLAIFFALAGVGLTSAFYLTASYFLQAQNDPRTSVYFVASAGLATVAGLVLWIGRLLTRLYLSEHHLRKDAEERQIMTTTYLALMRKSAAGETDRQVILTALFRNSSDGIVKDDGVSDMGLSALVSRLGIPTRG